MGNYYNIHDRVRHFKDIHKKNVATMNDYAESQIKLKFKSEMLFARLDFVIDVARQMSNEE